MIKLSPDIMHIMISSGTKCYRMECNGIIWS